MARSNHLKVYFVYGNSNAYSKDKRQKELEKIGTELNLKKSALTFVSSFSDTESTANLNKINPNVENTFVLYRNRTIINKFINFKPKKENFLWVEKELDASKGNYFDLNSNHHPERAG